MTAFTQHRVVEFAHCDPAGMVFYPRYVEMIAGVVERFFADALDYPWAAVLETGLGTPTGDIRVRFHAPSRVGDPLDFALCVTRIGTASLDLQIQCSSAGEPRFTCDNTVVHAETATARSRPWPEAQRARMAQFLTAAASGDTDRKKTA